MIHCKSGLQTIDFLCLHDVICHTDKTMVLFLQETATLADRLIQDQVIRAQKEEEIYVLRRDLSTQKQQYTELQQLYDTTVTELREFKEKVSTAHVQTELRTYSNRLNCACTVTKYTAHVY